LRCQACGEMVDEDARFCSRCGVQLGSVNESSDFEIGKIAALASIKKDILSWIGAPAAVIGAIIAILGWLGINQMVTSSVDLKVEKSMDKIKDGIDKEVDRLHSTTDRELEQERTSIDKITGDVLATLGKTEADQDQIASLISQDKQQISEAKTLLEQERSQIDLAKLNNDRMQLLLSQTDARRTALVKSIEDLNYAAFIGKTSI
jgi:uncharacterized membrane protein YvbJ